MKFFSPIFSFVGFFIVTLFLFANNQLVLAQTQGEGTELAKSFVQKINNAILFPLIMLLMAIAILVFLYGAFEYVSGADNDGVRDNGRRHLLWGTIGLLVMVSAVAILTIAANTFNLGNELNNSFTR